MFFMELLKKKGPDMAKMKANVDGMFFGYELFNLCLCGKEMTRSERQELYFYPEKQCWLRLCFKCIEAGKKASTHVTTTPPDRQEQTTSIPVHIIPLSDPITQRTTSP